MLIFFSLIFKNCHLMQIDLVSSYTALYLKIIQLLSSCIPAHVGAAVFLVATGFVPCEKRPLAVVFLCFALLCSGFTRGGYAVNHIDIGPK